MKVFEVAISMVSTILASHCFADSLDFLNEKHSILGYEKLEFYYQCTNGNQTTYSQKECSKIELELWEKVIRDIDDYVMVNGFGSDPLLSKKQYLLTQENWRTYVITDCRMQMDAYLGGSFAAVVQFSCPARKAKARVDELMSIIH
jgi:hypothetical protein|tara:strand:- start:217 stop:654 length:438 start_codon:yes stop_codon:yes gene_type:complete